MNANYIRNRLSNIRDAAYRANRALEANDGDAIEKELYEIEYKVRFIRENIRNNLEE